MHKKAGLRVETGFLASYGVSDGTRTRDTQDHNLVLYQLNYTHHSYWTEPSRVLFQ